jgi:hypothetical protein
MIRAIVHPPAKQMMGNGERVRAGEPFRMFPPDHHGRLRAIEPACIFKFRVIDKDVLVQRSGCASDHQR